MLLIKLETGFLGGNVSYYLNVLRLFLLILFLAPLFLLNFSGILMTKRILFGVLGIIFVFPRRKGV
ncbi:hypothetical protein AXF42_Ash013349 [Apostasia shenzhenica]|uniref:Uncharacterized protein n=1 Tax=Apostasia shenzhenica TaxID=1088818 RepID=A0A2I0BBP8_9ASPA|nr:hypothetical protein AXF42_Ash013349 [Apostasia shenzhenica]